MAGASTQNGESVSALLGALGIDPGSYYDFVAWCLAEELVSELARLVDSDEVHQTRPLWQRPDGLKRFRDLVRGHTNREWSQADLGRLYERVHQATEHHERKPIKAGDLLRVLWNQPHECKACGRRPPDVKLHVDHVFPASRGGSSGYDNLQFLCADHNLRKSNKLEEGTLWLDSV